MKEQQGGGLLIAVILLLMMSATLLHATRRQLDDSLSVVVKESRYIRQYSLAASALAWGSKRQWSAKDDSWYCQTENIYRWRACLRGLTAESYLMRGDSGPGSVAHFQWMIPGSEPAKMMPVPHGWIDYCPLAQEKMCEPDE
ncbi:DUF2509 family protein [Erwinia oleae]|uniref:DUF2509 family protein n=1 Tax=Erwinia oleae TaxID=796334 RepID=UPI00055577D1|nr:DUF2509 family protein [Erwinia oleae]